MNREDRDIEAFLCAVEPIRDGIQALGDSAIEIIKCAIEAARHCASVCRGAFFFVLRRWRRW